MHEWIDPQNVVTGDFPTQGSVAVFRSVGRQQDITVTWWSRPFLFGMIKKLVSERGLDATGLANLLLGQKATLAKANVDPRVTSALGFSSFSNMLERVPASLAAVAAPAVAKVVPAAPPPSSGLLKWLPWLAALIGAYLLWQAFAPKAPAPRLQAIASRPGSRRTNS
jgi:hypothetical protein